MIKSTNMNGLNHAPIKPALPGLSMDQQFQHQQTKDEPRSVKKENFYQVFSAAIALCMIAFFTMVWVPSASAAPNPTSVTIDAEFDFTSSDGVGGVLGTFTTVGALTISGDATMDFPLAIGRVFHCVIVLTAIDEITGTVTGTITIHQECQFGTSPAKGR